MAKGKRIPFYFVYMVVDRGSKNIIDAYEDQGDAWDYIEENDPDGKDYFIKACAVYYKKAKS